ncbi:MAG: peptidase MA family metallohydrolase, partial [bacterium]
SLTEGYAAFPKLVRHELVHILIGQAIDSPRRPPRWFSEGIAILLSNDDEFEGGRAISKALISDSIIPLDEIDNVLKFHQAKARLAYEESYSFLLFLEEKYGVDGLLKLVRSLDANTSLERAFTKIFAADLFDLEIEWYEFLGKKYRWRFLLDFEIFLWIFILFLFIFAFIGIRFRNRKIIKKWDKEEGLTDPNW